MIRDVGSPEIFVVRNCSGLVADRQLSFSDSQRETVPQRKSIGSAGLRQKLQ